MGRAAAHYQTLTRRDLSRRQREVLELIAAGKTNGEIAEQLGITLDGAKWHVSEILGKLGVPTREDAAEWWRNSGSLGQRVGVLARALAPFSAWKSAGIFAGVAGGAAAVVLLLAFFGSSGNPDVPPACTVDDVILEPVEASGPPAEQVVVSLTARNRGRECSLKAMATADIRPVGGAAPAVAPEMARIDLVLPAERTELAHILWTSWCGGGIDRFDARASLTRAGETEPFVTAGPLFVTNRPRCLTQEPGVPSYEFSLLPIALSSYAAELGPDPLAAIYCYSFDDPKWQKPCQIVDLLSEPLTSGNADAIMVLVETKPYVCPEPGTGGLGGPSYLCEGATAGEVREGIPVAFHGSEGDVFSVAQFEAAIEGLVAGSRSEDGLSHTRPATVACLSTSPDCTQFAIGIANDGSPPAAYLVFRVDGDKLWLTRVGFAGENALILRRGGEMRISGGPPEHFIPIVPPY